MESSTSYLSVPLMATPKYSAGPIIVAFVVIVIILGIIMYLFSSNPRYNDIRPKSETILTKIVNDTNLPHKLTIPNFEDITLEPGKDASLYIKTRGSIYAQAHNYDGEKINHKLTIAPNMNRIRITPDGFISSSGPFQTTNLKNDSPIAVVFIQKTQKGRRWGLYQASAYSVAADKIIGAGSTWEVAAVGEEDNPIDSIYISGVPTKIVFDGVKLTAS
jgi:hypothetical protein